MASRIIHTCIAIEICKVIDIPDKKRFFYGNILPDIVSLYHGSKDLSHFKGEPQSEFYTPFNYNSFYTKYKDKMSDSVYLGYLMHLIADDIWLRKIYIPYVKVNISENNKSELIKKYYTDFLKLNIFLIPKFNIKKDCVESVNDIPIEEINTTSKYSDMLIKEFGKDFRVYGKKYLDPILLEKLSILEYIEYTSKFCIEKIKELNLIE